MRVAMTAARVWHIREAAPSVRCAAGLSAADSFVVRAMNRVGRSASMTDFTACDCADRCARCALNRCRARLNAVVSLRTKAL